MGHQHCNVKRTIIKHLSYRDRLRIEILLKEKISNKEIAAAVGCSQRTIQREVRRGQVTQLNGASWEYFKVYSAEYAQNDYISKRGGSGTSLKIGHDHKLCEEIEHQIKKGYSPDVIAQNIRRRSDKFEITLSTRTIYNYLEKNIFLNVDYKDLVYGHYRKKKAIPVNRPSYRSIRGRSIEERPTEVNERARKGHWEIDLVLGGKGSGSECLLTLTERKSRLEIIRKLPDKTQDSVIHELDVLERQLGRKGFNKMFKTITADNGSEFLSNILMERSCLSRNKQRTQVFYAHPYSAYERGTNENVNRMIRRFIPKGTGIGQYTKREIKRIEQWLNTYPRKILDYLTPQEAYQLVT